MAVKIVPRDEVVAELACWHYKRESCIESAVLLKNESGGVSVGVLSYTDLETVLVSDTFKPFYKNYSQAMAAFGALIDSAVKD